MAAAAELLAADGIGVQTAPVLVLGLGNILLTDEGVGVAVIERLEQQYRLPDERGTARRRDLRHDTAGRPAQSR